MHPDEYAYVFLADAEKITGISRKIIKRLIRSAYMPWRMHRTYSGHRKMVVPSVVRSYYIEYGSIINKSILMNSDGNVGLEASII